MSNNQSLGSLVGRMGGTTPSDFDSTQPETDAAPEQQTPAPAESADSATAPEPGISGSVDTARAGERKAPPSSRKKSGSSANKSNTAPSKPTAPEAASSMSPKVKQGNLVQARVLPPDVGDWFNQVVDVGQFVFGSNRGNIAGAILLVAQQHSDEVIELLEAWGGTPSEHMKKMLWEQFINTEHARREQS